MQIKGGNDMKLKGHATIELTDVNTGEKVVHEDDNMITNAIAKLLGFSGVPNVSGGTYALNYGISDLYSPLKRLTGGLLLFDSQLEEDPDLIYPPAGVSLVGCASGISYSGGNTMAGSYNKAESGKIDGGYKHVWDFGTSQANGQIACACLTTMAGGKVTSGSYPYSSDYVYKSGASTDVVDEITFKGANNIIYMTKAKEQVTPTYETARAILFLDGKRNRLLKVPSIYWSKCYYSASSGDQEKFQESLFYKKSIDIIIERFGISTFSIFDSPGTENYMKNAAYDSMALETVTVEMPSGLKALITDDMINNYNRRFGCSLSNDDNNIYIAIKLATASTSYNYVIEKNAKFYVWKINAETFESTYFEVTNTTNEQIQFANNTEFGKGGMSANFDTDVCVFDDYVLCFDYSSKEVYCINLNDNTDVSVVTFHDGERFHANSSYGFGTCFYESGRMNVSRSGSSYSQMPGYYFVVDPILKQAGYKNIAPSSLWGSTSGYVSSPKAMSIAGTFLKCYLTSNANTFDCTLIPFVDPALLITINNLSSPVLKTASQTMKVTYTLTQVVEE